MRGSLGRVVDLLALFFAVVPGVISLVGTSAGSTLLLLRVIAVMCTLVIIIRLAHRQLVVRNRDLSATISRLAEENRELTLARDEARTLQADFCQSVTRLAEAQTLLHKDRATLRLTIGEDAGGDEILEDVVTEPNHVMLPVLHRSMRPIVPSGLMARLADIDLHAEIDDGAILPPLALSEDVGRLRVWLRFVPGLTRATSWKVRYRPAGLWDPLRRNGVDELRWDDSMQNSIDGVSALVELRILFVFPPGRAHCAVKERQNLGYASEPYLERTGHTIIEWRDPRPAGRRYHWDLTMAPIGAERSRTPAQGANSGSQPTGVAG